MSKPDSMWPIIAIILAGAVVVLANNARKNNQSLEAWIEDLENQQHNQEADNALQSVKTFLAESRPFE
jgi:exopolysaccharide biosynthesis predicted pyruvyltransferase EpsI